MQLANMVIVYKRSIIRRKVQSRNNWPCCCKSWSNIRVVFPWGCHLQRWVQPRFNRIHERVWIQVQNGFPVNLKTLCNAPGTFQRCMISIFSDFLENCIEVFMDDFTVYGSSFDGCLNSLEKVLNLFSHKFKIIINYRFWIRFYLSRQHSMLKHWALQQLQCCTNTTVVQETPPWWFLVGGGV